MALLEEWILSERVNEALRLRVENALTNILPEGALGTARIEAAFLYADVTVKAGDLIELGETLDAPLRHFEGWEWEKEIDPVDNDAAAAYALRVEIVEKQPETFEPDDGAKLTILSVYSKDANNLAGWPVAFVLAARLAKELGGREPDEDPSPEVLN